jgi:MFS family permease
LPNTKAPATVTAPDKAISAGAIEPGPSFRGALKSRDFTLLFFGQLTGGVGSGMLQLALPWLVLELTGSALQLGFAYFFQFLPMLLFGILGGVFVDRWDRRLTIVVVDAIRGLAFLSVGAIYYFDGLTVEHIYAVIFLESSLANFFNPARAALMPNLVAPSDLRAANSLMEISRNIGFFIAPPVGGVFIAIVGPAAVLLGDGITFLLSGITVFMIRWRPAPREPVQYGSLLDSARRVLHETREGIRPIGSKRLLQVAVLLGIALNIIVAPIQLLLPLFVVNVKHQDASYLGLLIGGMLAGVIAGLLTAPALSHRFGLGRVATGAVLMLGGVISIASLPPTIWPPLIGMTIAGFAIGSLNMAQTTMLQNATTDEERGRVTAANFTATLGIRPFSFLLVGALAETADIRLMFVIMGVLALLLGAFLSRLPEVREAH